MLTLRVKAPFATFRPLSAGSFRPTAPFITPTAAYGLLLNIAGIESRQEDAREVMTLMRDDLPAFRLAIGQVCSAMNEIAPSATPSGDGLPLEQSIFSNCITILLVQAARNMRRPAKARNITSNPSGVDL